MQSVQIFLQNKKELLNISHFFDDQRILNEYMIKCIKNLRIVFNRRIILKPMTRI